MLPRRLAPKLLPVALALASALVVACGDGSSPPRGGLFPTVISLGQGEVFPIITNHALAVGENRLSLRLIDRDEMPVLNAGVSLRFFDLNGPEPVSKFEAEARFVPVVLSYVDEASGGEKQEVGDDGVYVAYVAFDGPGRWGMEVAVARDGRQLEPIPFSFDVLEAVTEPSVGDPAPPSRQLTVADVVDVSEIDSSYPPRPHMHDITVADALEAGMPIVVAFATPAFCETRTCAPVMDTVMDPLYRRYGSQVRFIHIEPYRLKELREGDEIPVPATEEWGLLTEPWLFVIDRQGRVAAKFEGVVARDEVEAVLEGL